MTMKTSCAGALLLACWLCTPGWAATEQFKVVSSNEVVGSLEATVQGSRVDIAYQVSNNGRGPKLSEHIELGADRLPASWTIDGTTAFGGKVAESFRHEHEQAVWQSQADRGSVPSVRRLYIANDASPWSYGIYARALLREPRKTLEVLPSGTLTIEKARELKIQDVRVTAYVLTGVNLTPDIVLLDGKDNLFARIDSSAVLVRAGYERHAQTLLALGRDMDFDRLTRLQQRAGHRHEQPLRIVNARVFDPRSERLTEPTSVVVYRGRVASIQSNGSAVMPVGEQVIDGRGGTLVPGLHDMHSHSSAWSGVFYLAAGVTNVRDLGNDNAELLKLVDKMDAAEVPGPRVTRAGLIEGRSQYSARIGFIADSLEEALADVRWYAEHGYRQIKIYNSMNPDWVSPMATQAHRLGMRVSGHVPAFMSPDRAIRDGYDEINHINQLVLGWLLGPQEDTRTPLRLTALGERTADLDLAGARVNATVELMKERGTALDTTIVTLERLMMSRAGTVQSGDAPYLDHMPVGYQRYRKRSFVNFKSTTEEQQYAKSFARLLQILGKLHAAGIRLLPGTDDGTGFTVHRELELYVEAGIAPGRVLSMATLGCAQYLGQDQELGSIEPGKRADFFLVDGDPTRDMSAIRKARFVMKDDRYYLPAELYEALGIAPFVDAPVMRNVE